MKTTLGIEVELNLVDRLGYIANAADMILEDTETPSCFVAECRKSQVELNSLPFATVDEVYTDVVGKLQLLERLSEKYEVFAVSVSEYGAGKGIWRSERAIEQAYTHVLGLIGNEELTTISGIHAHFSQDQTKLVEQYNLFLALDPLSFAITSTSPIRYDGMNSINCHRIDIVRNKILREFPFHGQLMPYLTEIEELENQDGLRLHEWENFSPLFTKTNTNFSPVRKRDRIGPGTFEVRSFDTAPIKTAFGAIALYKGCVDAVVEGEVSIEVAREDNKYQFTSEGIVLPTYRTLKNIEKEAVMYGLKSDMVQEYAAEVATFAKKYLPCADQKYLNYLDIELETRFNPADQIMQFLRGKGYTQSRFTPAQCAAANLFMREKYAADLY